MTAAMQGIVLTPHQQLAYDGLVECLQDTRVGMAVLEGFAGCGKTTLVATLVSALARRNWHIAIAAPTNKAVAVLDGKVAERVDARTVHSLLGQVAARDGDGGRQARQIRPPAVADYDLVIIDECSMISTAMLRDIVQHRGSARILFVGDPAQLPPVGERLESPVFRDIQHKVRLSEIVRQAADNPIIAMTMPIRQAIEEQRRVTLEEIAAVIPEGATQAAVMTGGMQLVSDIAIGEQKRGVDCRVVAFRNARVQAYNAVIHAALHGAPEGRCEFAPEERVIVHEEFRCLEGRRIHNGEELIFRGAEPMESQLGFEAWSATLTRDCGSTVRAVIPTRAGAIEEHIRQQWTRRRPIAERGRRGDALAHVEARAIADHIREVEDAFARLRHAYAITAHKSQGSTFHTVLVDWGDLSAMRDAFEFNRGLYVAASRASHHMAIIT
jgi:exodeoxyribonuclease-5